jgi:hypothetical protein
MNNTRKARQVIAEARDVLGGNGILLNFHVIPHMADIEAIHTCPSSRATHKQHVPPGVADDRRTPEVGPRSGDLPSLPLLSAHPLIV